MNAGFYETGCLLCGKPLEYFSPARELVCVLCGKRAESNAACEDGHFVCDKCHAQRGYDYITMRALEAKSKNPLKTAIEIMKSSHINMHGPEHHYLVAASILSAYRNAGGMIDLEKCLEAALQRASKVPGGICGLWGSCGAAIGAGISISVATAATPLSEKEWSLANLATSECLRDISENGGPRCCKRDTFLALARTVIFVKEHLGIEMETPERVVCGFFPKNSQCRNDGCVFYPKH